MKLLLLCMLNLGLVFCVNAMDNSLEQNEQQIIQALETELISREIAIEKKNDALLIVQKMKGNMIKHLALLQEQRRGLLRGEIGILEAEGQGLEPVSARTRNLLKRYFQEEQLILDINEIIVNQEAQKYMCE